MRGFRSPMLGALLALACTPSMEVARREDYIHHLFFRSVSMHAPDLDHAETVKLLLADARALQLVGGRYEDCARRVADDFEAWANGGRRPILLRDEAVAGEWRARIAFTGPGSYRGEAYRNASTPSERGEVIVREAATRADAWRVAVEEAKARALDASAVADAFMRRHGIRDDLVKQPADLSPEARAKREAWFASVLGDSKASAPSGSAWSPEDAADMATRLGPAKMQALREYFAEHPDAKVAVVGIDHGPEVLSAIRDDAGRALAHVAMPAGRPLTIDDMRRTAAELEQHAIKPDPDGFYRIPRFDDPGVQERLAEREVIGRAFSSAMSDGMTGRDRGMSPQDYRREAIEGMAADRAVIGIDLAAPGGDRTIVTRETDFQRAQRLAMNTAADRAFASMSKAAERARGAVSALSAPAQALCDKMRALDYPRYSARPKPARPLKGPEARAEKRERKASRTAAKKRRGWA